MRIEVQPNGPYRVFGSTPLKEMAPVHTFNGEPVAWHTLEEVPLETATYELCRCGNSQNKPFCDCGHEAAGFDGRETASRVPYLQRARLQARGGEILADDGPLCIHAGFCGTRTTTVWKLFGQSDDATRRQDMREMVWRCPAGRISLFSEADGTSLDPVLPQEIAVLPGGPLWVRGEIPIIGADGRQWEARNRITLCRCGASTNKPFCDGAHARLHFDER